MGYQISIESTEDAKEPPDPGQVASSLLTNNNITTSTKQNLSVENLRYYNIYHLQLQSPEASFSSFLGLSSTSYFDLYTPSSYLNYNDNLHNFLIRSNETATIFLLKELFQYHNVTNDNHLSKVVKHVNIITSKYCIFYKPTFKVFHKSFLVLQKLLPSPKFHILLSDIKAMDWAHCGITNPHSITKITTFLRSLTHTNKSTVTNNIAIIHSTSYTDNFEIKQNNPSITSIPTLSYEIISNPTSTINPNNNNLKAPLLSKSNISISNTSKAPSFAPSNTTTLHKFFVHYYTSPPIYNPYQFSNKISATNVSPSSTSKLHLSNHLEPQYIQCSLDTEPISTSLRNTTTQPNVPHQQSRHLKIPSTANFCPPPITTHITLTHPIVRHIHHMPLL